MPNKFLLVAMTAAFMGGCATQHTNLLARDKSLIVGLWAMQSLGEGSTSVAEFRPDGQLLLHSFNCVKSSQEETDVIGYTVANNGQVINMLLPTKTLPLKVLAFSPKVMQLASQAGNLETRYDYEKVDKVDSVCERYPELAAERARNTPYKGRDFVPAPGIPEHSGMDRYLGKWGSNKTVELEVTRNADGGLYLYTKSDGNWHYLYNDVHWVGDALHFHAYTYSDSKALFRYPKHKLLTPTNLVPLSDGRLRQNFTANGDPYTSVLMRIE